MRHRLATVLILAFFMLSAMQTAAPLLAQRLTGEGPVVARVSLRNSAEVERFVKLGLDILEMREGNDLFILTSIEQLNDLRTKGWAASVDKTQTELLNSQRNLDTFRSGYRTVTEMRAYVDSKAAQYPNLAEVFTYGQSWEKVHSGGAAGSDLFGITLTNRQIAGPKPTFFLMAAVHAREIVTCELALRFVDYLLTNYGTDGDVTWMLDENKIVIVPVANPDGHALAEQSYFQRKNTNTSYGGGCANPPTTTNQYGVDLNRNSDFKWGTINTPSEPRCGQTYPGPSVASEPEIAALETLVRSLFPDQRGPLDTDPAPLTASGFFLTLHSYSNLVLWPWGWTSQTSPNDTSFVYMGTKFASYNSFTAEQSVGLYPTSGTTDDWAYGELGVAAFTFEVGPSSGTCGGFFPPFTCLDGNSGGSFWPRNLPAFLYAARITRAPYQLALGPSPESLTATATLPNIFDLRAQLNEQYNGGQTIAAAELYVDTPPWRGGSPLAMTALDGSFNSAIETAAASIGPLYGKHLIYVRGRDSLGNWGPVRGVFVNGADCPLTVFPTSAGYDIAGGAGIINLNTPAGCPWSASTNDDWIKIVSANSGTGSATVSYTVRNNPNDRPRAGSVNLSGQTYTINQAGSSQSGCRFLIWPTSVTVGVNGGVATVNIATSPECLWTATSTANWITVTSSPSGFDAGTVSLQVAANTTLASRIATVLVGGKSFVVKQKGQ
jgi:carboxypeptidase T